MLSSWRESRLDPCRRLERDGVKVTYVQPRADGLVDVEAVEQALAADTVLMTVMTANNEIGVLQPVAELSALARRRGVLFHTDATQAVGKVPFDVVGLDDVAVSTGAACTSANPEPSHVLSALGLSDQLAHASIRFGLGRWNTPDEVDYVVEKVRNLVVRLRQMSPG